MGRVAIVTYSLSLMLCVPAAVSLAQSGNGQMKPEPRIRDGVRTEWAITPELDALPPGAASPAESRIPDGTVLDEPTLLPAGTRLPGGAILPGSPPEDARSTHAETGSSTEPVVVKNPGQTADTDIAAGVPYISGGIGVSGREEMELVKSKFNLRLLFAVQGSGAYLADLTVRIQDAAGAILLTAVSRGPWFYASLAPGRYILSVDNAGQVQTREVTIPFTGATEQSFYWAD